MAEATATEKIAALASEWGFPATAEQVQQIAGYFDLLLRWNARVNLTGATSLDVLLAEHLPDSFALARLSPAGARVVDIGAGGGLPGIPFGLLRPDCHTTLVEPRAKRTAFLAAAKREVGGSASLTVVRGRDDEVAAASFDLAGSRATFQPDEWLRLAARLVRPAGLIVVFATEPVDGRAAGFALSESIRYSTGRRAPRWAGAFVSVG